MLCSIYKSLRKEGMYLYVEKTLEFPQLPEPLLKTFGSPKHTFDLLLHPERPLAIVDVMEVMETIKSQGFYLQMPPGDVEKLALGE